LFLSVILKKSAGRKEKNIVNGEDSGEILGATDCLIPFGSPVKSGILAVSVSLLSRNSISISSSSEEDGGGEEGGGG
jgi:ribonuclease PH